MFSVLSVKMLCLHCPPSLSVHLSPPFPSLLSQYTPPLPFPVCGVSEVTGKARGGEGCTVIGD